MVNNFLYGIVNCNEKYWNKMKHIFGH